MDQPVIAIFIDVDNLTQWVKEGGVDTLMSTLAKSPEDVRVRKAYGVWSGAHLHHLQEPLNALGFDLVHSYHPVSGKNSADIQMTIDAMEVALTRDDIDKIVLATGDSDFSPLFRRLRNMGKTVVGVGSHSVLSETVKSSCSEFIFTDTQGSYGAGAETSVNMRNKKVSRASLHKVTKHVKKVLSNSAQPIHLSVLKNKLITEVGTFKESDWGYSSFLSFLQGIHGLNVFQEEGCTHWLCSIDFNPDLVPIDLTPYMVAAETEPYKQLLRKINWPFAELRVLQYLHRTLPGVSPKHFIEIKEHIFDRLGLISDDAESSPSSEEPGVNRTLIRKGCGLLHRVGLFRQGEDGRLTYAQTEVYLAHINRAMIARIEALCDQHDVAYNEAEVAVLLYPVEADEQAVCQ